MSTNKKTTPEEHWKIFNFFSQGEFITSIQAKNRNRAIEIFKEEGFKNEDYDFVIGYEPFRKQYFVGVDFK